MVSYDVWVLSRCCQERDCNAVSFEHRFICQSLVNVTVVYHRKVQEKLDMLNA